jgi:flagellin
MNIPLGKIPSSPKGKETIMVGSVNTNISAQVALSALNYTGTQLSQVQKRISTGLNVSDALDNGAVFAIAQNLRSDVGAVAAVNGQLGAAKGLLSVANAAGTGVSNTLVDVRSVLVQLADQNVTGNARNQLNAQYATLKSAVNNYISGASYNGANLLSASASNRSVIQDISANQYLLAAQDLNTNVTSVLTAVSDSTGAAALLTGAFVSAQNFVGTALNSLAANSKFLDNQITFNSQFSDATTQGLGALVDADLAKESARLQSLQIKQQLGTQSLGIANQSPQTLLGLFR